MDSNQTVALLMFIIIPTICELIFIYQIRVNYRRYRMIADNATSKIRSAPQGYVELKGVAAGDPNYEYANAPFSHRPCLWYEVKTYEKKISEDSEGNEKTEWDLIYTNSSSTPYRLVDDTGSCLLYPEGADITPTNKLSVYSAYSSVSAEEILSGRTVGDYDKYRFVESVITADAPLYALGQFETTFDEQEKPQHALVKPEFADHPFVISTKEEENLLTSYRNRIIGFSIGVILVLPFYAGAHMMFTQFNH